MTGVDSHASMAQAPELEELLEELNSLSQQQSFVYDASFKLLEEASKLRAISNKQAKCVEQLSRKVESYLRVHGRVTRFEEAIAWTKGESLD